MTEKLYCLICKRLTPHGRKTCLICTPEINEKALEESGQLSIMEIPTTDEAA